MLQSKNSTSGSTDRFWIISVDWGLEWEKLSLNKFKCASVFVNRQFDDFHCTFGEGWDFLFLCLLYNSNEPQESGFCKSSAAVCPLRRLLYLVLAQFSEKNREYQSSEPRSLRRTRLLHKMCLFNNFPGPCRSSPANFQRRQSIFTKDLDFELEVDTYFPCLH